MSLYFLLAVLLGHVTATHVNAYPVSSIDWDAIKDRLPTEKNDESKEQRLMFFTSMDINRNGLLSLAEVHKGVRDVIKIDELSDAKPAIMRAFQIAKNSKKSRRGDRGDDYVELREFKFFLLSLRQYFEYFVAFSRVDTSGDKRIEFVEFVDNRETIEKWVGEFDAEEEFKKIDKNGGGFILFDEFCDWAITKNLDLEDDDD